jgi:hypothetical protein
MLKRIVTIVAAAAAACAQADPVMVPTTSPAPQARGIFTPGQSYDELVLPDASAVQQCDRDRFYRFDTAGGTISRAQVNRNALAYAQGLPVSIPAPPDTKHQGDASITGTAQSDGTYALEVSAKPDSAGRSAPGPMVVNRYRYTYAAPIGAAACPIGGDDLEDQSLGPASALSLLHALLPLWGFRYAEQLAPIPAGVPTQVGYDVQFPSPARGIVVRLHVQPAAAGDPALELPARFAPQSLERKRERLSGVGLEI